MTATGVATFRVSTGVSAQARELLTLIDIWKKTEWLAVSYKMLYCMAQGSPGVALPPNHYFSIIIISL
jgi:hypothetical protein